MKIVKIMLCELWNGVKQPLVDLWRFFRHGHGLKLFQIAWNIQLEKWQIASDKMTFQRNAGLKGHKNLFCKDFPRSPWEAAGSAGLRN